MSNISLSNSSRLDQIFHLTRYSRHPISVSYVDSALSIPFVFSLHREDFNLRGGLDKPIQSQHRMPIGRLSGKTKPEMESQKKQDISYSHHCLLAPIHSQRTLDLNFFIYLFILFFIFIFILFSLI